MNKPKDPSLPLEDEKSIPADPAQAGSSEIFCEDPAQVRAGFALALQLMGIVAPVPEDVSEHDPPKQKA